MGKVRLERGRRAEHIGTISTSDNSGLRPWEVEEIAPERMFNYLSWPGKMTKVQPRLCTP